jgi:hypothetical protein
MFHEPLEAIALKVPTLRSSFFKLPFPVIFSNWAKVDSVSNNPKNKKSVFILCWFCAFRYFRKRNELQSEKLQEKKNFLFATWKNLLSFPNLIKHILRYGLGLFRCLEVTTKVEVLTRFVLLYDAQAD